MKDFAISKSKLDIILECEPSFVSDTLKEVANIKDSLKRERYIKNTYGYNFKYKLVKLLIDIDIQCNRLSECLSLNVFDELDFLNFLKNHNILEKIAFIYSVDISVVMDCFSKLPNKAQLTFNYLFGLNGRKQMSYDRLLEFFSYDDDDLFNVINSNYRSIVRKISSKEETVINYHTKNYVKQPVKVSKGKETKVSKKEITEIEENDEDLVNDLIEYYEAFGYKKEDIINCCNRYNDILGFNYNIDYKLNNLPKTNTKKMALVGFIANIDGDLCQLIIHKCKRDKKAYHVTPYNNESVFSLYVYYGKKGIPADIVEEASHYLSETDKGEMKRLFTDKKYLRCEDPKLSEFINKFDYVITNIEDIRKEKMMEEKKVLSDSLNLSEKECDFVYHSLTKDERNYLITLNSYSLKTKISRYKTEGIKALKINKLKALCNIKTLLTSLGYDYETVCREVSDLSDYYDLSTGELRSEISDASEIERILESYLTNHESKLFYTYAYLIEYIFYLVKTNVLTYNNVINLYEGELLKTCTLFSVINKNQKMDTTNLSLLELLVYYNELMTCIRDYMEIYLSQENEHNLNKRIVNGNLYSVEVGYNKLKTL